MNTDVLDDEWFFEMIALVYMTQACSAGAEAELG